MGATKKTTTPKAKTTKPTKATLKKITAVKRAAGKKAKKAAGKANALAMKKKGVGIFAPKVLSPALATICGGKKMARTEVTKKIWAYIKKNSLSGPNDQAGFGLEGHLPGGEHRHAQDGRVRQQAPVVSPWASPGDSAEEFRRRAGLSSRDLTSSTLV